MKKTTVERTKAEIDKLLAEQIYFLNKSCIDYDNGILFEAVRIATSLRNLLYNDGKSLKKSLFFRTNLDSMRFIDYRRPKDKNVIFEFNPGSGLLLIHCADGHDSGFIPVLNTGPFRPTLSSFSNWWRKDKILSISNNIKLTRKDIVLLVANTEGGTHVDDHKNGSEELLRGIEEDLKIIIDSHTIDLEKRNKLFALVRQIAFEVNETLKLNRPLVRK